MSGRPSPPDWSRAIKSKEAKNESGEPWLEEMSAIYVELLEGGVVPYSRKSLAEAAFAIGFYVGATYRKPEAASYVESDKDSKGRKGAKVQSGRAVAAGKGGRRRK